MIADADEAHDASWDTADPCKLIPVSKGHAHKTVFGQKWLVWFFDELHGARNVGKQFFSCMAVGRLSDFVVGLTATPVTGKINDIWNIARILRLVGSSDDDTLRRFAKDINAAHRQFTKEMREGEENDVEAIFRSVASGEEQPNESATAKEIGRAMRTVRAIFENRVIYRTRTSKDFNDDQHQAIPIPCAEIPLVFDLPEHEMEHLRRCANEMKAKKPNAGSFYLMPEVRGFSMQVECSNGRASRTPAHPTTPAVAWENQRYQPMHVQLLWLYAACRPHRGHPGRPD